MLGGPGGTRDEFSHWLNNRTITDEAGVDLVNEFRNQPGIEYWFSDGGVIIVQFDQGGQVYEKQLLGIWVSTARQGWNRWQEQIGL